MSWWPSVRFPAPRSRASGCSRAPISIVGCWRAWPDRTASLPAEPPPIVGGSHDPLLQWALSESRAGLAILPEGSEAGYRRFLKGEVIAAAIHFHDLDDPEKDANLEIVGREATLFDAVLIGFAARDQGLIVASGNPLGLASLRDASRASCGSPFVRRVPGPSSCCSACSSATGLSVDDLVPRSRGADRPGHRPGHPRRPCRLGVATRAVATAAGLGFVPLCVEHFDLLMRQRDYFRPPLQTFLTLLADSRFADQGAGAWRARCVRRRFGALVTLSGPCSLRKIGVRVLACVQSRDVARCHSRLSSCSSSCCWLCPASRARTAARPWWTRARARRIAGWNPC